MKDTSQEPISQTAEDIPPEEQERDDAVIALAFRRSLAVIGMLAVLAAAGVYWWNRPGEVEPEREGETVRPSLREAPPVEIPMLPWTDITLSAGIEFVHENGAAGEKLLPETMGSGCAFLDFDGDRAIDLLLVNSRRWPHDEQPEAPPTLALYRNNGAGQFVDVTQAVGLDISLYGMGVAVGDYDCDGRVDIFISAVGTNRLLRNTADGFVDVTAQAGVAGDPQAWSSSCGWFDYDRDGDLDLFVANYLEWSREQDLKLNFTLQGTQRAYGRPQEFRGTFPYLYRNEGDGQFVEVAEQAGLHIRHPSTGEPVAKSLGVTFADLTGDAYPEIVVANDTVQNLLFVNQRDGTFAEMAAMTGIAYDISGQARGAMGIDVARIRGDAATAIAIGNFSNEMTALYVTATDADSPLFKDEAVSNGLGPVTRLELTFGLVFFDPDLNGRLDLFAANGHLEEDINLVQPTQSYEQPPQLLWNCGPQYGTEFMPVPAEKCGDDFVLPMVGRGAASADIDGDGDPDLVITAAGRRPRLLRNDQQLGHHWLRVHLVGDPCPDAIGSRVVVETKDGVQQRQVMPTRSYLSQSELTVTFGLGKLTEVQRVTVFWVDGSRQDLGALEIDRLHVVTQDKAAPSGP